MNLEELKATDVWELYEKHKRFMMGRHIYSDTDLNHRMYNGDQWYGLKIVGVEKIQMNFIKPVVKYKVANITSNLYAACFNSDNIETTEFRQESEKICELLNKLSSKVYDKDFLDRKIKKWVRQAAINDEAVAYVYYNEESNIPVNEVISKNDIMYGNENDDEVQLQPYILLRQRKSLIETVEFARKNGISEEEIQKIITDKDSQLSAGDSAKDEIGEKVTIITKMWREKGTIHFTQSCNFVDLIKDADTKLTLYPVAHLNWEDQEGNARGIGEVRQLIANQLETNKTAMRRALTVKNTAYPQKVINASQIQNKKDVGKVGAIIEFKDNGMNLKASDVFMNTTPAQMSSDSEKLENELITNSRELAGAGDIATGDINPESASGRAILAVQQASQQPLNDQMVSLKAFLEELARIWLDMWKVYSDGLDIEVEDSDPITGESIYRVEHIVPTQLESLKASVKIDITPKGAYDKYAQELSLENMFTTGKITLEEYVEALDPDSVMPKSKLEAIVKKRQEKAAKIQDIQMEAEKLKMMANKTVTDAQEIAGIQNAGNQLIAQQQGQQM